MLLQRSMDHAQRARQLVATGNEASLRYAALETRMAIEEAFYALIPHYRDELPSSILKQWQPRVLMDALLECDPMVKFYQQVTLGDRTSPEGIVFTGQQQPISRELLRKDYQKLGSYLHAPKDEKALDTVALAAFLADVLTRIEQHCRETTVIHNGGIYFEHSCVCGRTIKRNLFSFMRGCEVKCLDENCAAVYDVEIIEGGSRWHLRHVVFPCVRCKARNRVGTHLLQEGRSFNCESCSVSYDIHVGPVAALRQEASENSTSEDPMPENPTTDDSTTA